MPSAGHVSPTSSLSSFSIVSHSRSFSFDDDDDEIVFSPPRRGMHIDWSSADEDYILLSPPLSSRAISPRAEQAPAASLAAGIAALKLDLAPAVRDEEAVSATPIAAAHTVLPSASARRVPSPRQATPQPTKRQPTKSQTAKAKPASTKGGPKLQSQRRGASPASEPETSTYQGAVDFISHVLTDPAVAAKQKLPFLQALLVELGICKPAVALPGSINAARALLKAQAHINVRDYIAARGQGVDALRAVMFPSRAKLVRDLRQRRVPLQWVKEHGLSVFLLSM